MTLDQEQHAPPWPGLHPGTGTNDHGPHHWERYTAIGNDGLPVEIRACQICGVPHPDDRGGES